MEQSIQIKIEKSQGGKSVVSARELHSHLEISTKFVDWFNRMKEYGFVENQDFTEIIRQKETNNPKNPYTTITDYTITLDMAKELCMIQRTEKGKQCRNYFIKKEKSYNIVPKSFSEALWYASKQAELNGEQQNNKYLLQNITSKDIEEDAEGIKFMENLKRITSNCKPEVIDKYYTYFLKDTTGLIKIGKTKNLLKRYNTINTGNPLVEFLFAIDIDEETKIHKKFQNKCFNKEWFSLTKEDLENIKKEYQNRNIKIITQLL